MKKRITFATLLALAGFASAAGLLTNGDFEAADSIAPGKNITSQAEWEANPNAWFQRQNHVTRETTDGNYAQYHSDDAGKTPRFFSQYVLDAGSTTGEQTLEFDTKIFGASAASDFTVHFFTVTTNSSGDWAGGINQNQNWVNGATSIASFDVDTSATTGWVSHSETIDFGTGYEWVGVAVYFDGGDTEFQAGVDNIDIVSSTAKSGSLFIVK